MSPDSDAPILAQERSRVKHQKNPHAAAAPENNSGTAPGDYFLHKIVAGNKSLSAVDKIAYMLLDRVARKAGWLGRPEQLQKNLAAFGVKKSERQVERYLAAFREEQLLHVRARGPHQAQRQLIHPQKNEPMRCEPRWLDAYIRREITAADVLVLMAVGSRAYSTGVCWASHQTLASDIGEAARTVRRRAGALGRRGWLDGERAGRTNHYRILGVDPGQTCHPSAPNDPTRLAGVEVDDPTCLAHKNHIHSSTVRDSCSVQEIFENREYRPSVSPAAIVEPPAQPPTDGPIPVEEPEQAEPDAAPTAEPLPEQVITDWLARKPGVDNPQRLAPLIVDALHGQPVEAFTEWVDRAKKQPGTPGGPRSPGVYPYWAEEFAERPDACLLQLAEVRRKYAGICLTCGRLERFCGCGGYAAVSATSRLPRHRLSYDAAEQAQPHSIPRDPTPEDLRREAIERERLRLRARDARRWGGRATGGAS